MDERRRRGGSEEKKKGKKSRKLGIVGDGSLRFTVGLI